MNRVDSQWYAVYTRSRHEKTVASKLKEKNIEVFLPLRKVLRRWKDRRKEIEVPLFNGYVFVRIPLTDRLHILKTPGVVQILSEGNKPVPIPEEQIESIQLLVTSGLKYDPYPYLDLGRDVLIKRGPLQGIVGKIVDKKKSARHTLIISIDLIKRSVSIEVDVLDIEPL